MPVTTRPSRPTFALPTNSCLAAAAPATVRARDGLVVYQGAGPYGTCSVTRVFADGVFYWVPMAVRVVPGDPPKAEVAWSLTRETMEDLAQHCYAWKYPAPHLSGSIDFTSPVLADGRLIYFGWHRLTTFDAATGKVLASDRVPRSPVAPLAKGVTKNWAYGGMVRGGDHLFVVHDNGLVRIFPLNEALAPMQACALPEDTYAQPVCDGSALFLRTLGTLYCFQKGAE